MKDTPNIVPILSSGFHKLYFFMGSTIGIICVYVLIFKGETLRDASFMIMMSLGLLFLGRPGKIKLTSTDLIIRKLGVFSTSYSLANLTWVYPTDEGGAYIYFGENRIDLGTEEPGYKKFRAAFEKIASDRLSYFGYMFTDRASIKRGQLSGCLDCHSLFPPQEIKNWAKVSESRWTKPSDDIFFPKCPECGEPWVFTDKFRGQSATLEGIQKMDAVLWKDKEGNRQIPFGLF